MLFFDSADDGSGVGAAAVAAMMEGHRDASGASMLDPMIFGAKQRSAGLGSARVLSYHVMMFNRDYRPHPSAKCPIVMSMVVTVPGNPIPVEQIKAYPGTIVPADLANRS